MTEDSFRFDEVTGSFVAVAPSRRGASVHLDVDPGAGLPPLSGRCPFCPGHEADTEETLHAIPEAGPWRVRVVRNRYPLVRAAATHASPREGFGSTPADGAHEVVVEARAHDADLCDLSADHVADVLRVYRSRVRTLASAPAVRSVGVFRNRGRRAGSSQPHPHGQLVATSVVGPLESARDAAARAHFEEHGVRLLDAIVAREVEAAERVVEANDDVVVLCPWAPHFDHQAWIVPRAGGGSIAGADDEVIVPLAEALVRTLGRVRRATGGADYNLVFRLPPVASFGEPHAFWYLDVLPRGGGFAGYEVATGIDIVTVAPEQAARELRAAP